MTEPTPDDDRRLPQHRPDDSGPRGWPLAVSASCPGCPYTTVHKRVLVPVTSTSGAHGKLVRATYECASCGHTSGLWRSYEDADEWEEMDKLNDAERVPETTFTGVVVQEEEPLVVDDGHEARSIEAKSGVDAFAPLGDRVTVRGHLLDADARMIASEIEEADEADKIDRAVCPNGCCTLVVTDRGEEGGGDRYRVECPDCGFVAGTIA